VRLATATRRGAIAPKLPQPYPLLERAGLYLRQGQTSLWIAASGVGKSQMLNNLAQRMCVPTLYWSADTDQNDVLLRTAALWSGSTTEVIEQRLHEPAWRDYYARVVEKSAHVDWVFDSAITPPVMSDRLRAFAEVHGRYPALAVLDNLSNTVQNQSDEWSEQKEVMVGMQRLARETGCHIAVLAHAKGEYESGLKPIPKNGSLNNMFRTPEVGVTLHRASEDGKHLGLCVVKNRSGKDDPGAHRPLVLEVDFSTATVKGFRVAA